MNPKDEELEALTRVAIERWANQRLSHVSSIKALAHDKGRADRWFDPTQRVVLLSHQQEAVNKGVKRQFDALHDALYSSPWFNGYEAESLINLGLLSIEACLYGLDDFFEPTYLAEIISCVCRFQNLGHEQLCHLQRAVKVIANALKTEAERLAATSPIKPKRGGQTDTLFLEVGKWLLVMHWARAKDRSYLAGDATLKKFRSAIEKLPYFVENPKAWALVIRNILWSDSRERKSLRPGGTIYEAITGPATGNRQGKERKDFRNRFGVSTLGYLERTHEQRMEVKDLSKRAHGEPLSEAKATTALRRARRIEAMKPSEAELKGKLLIQIETLMESIRRNLPLAGIQRKGK